MKKLSRFWAVLLPLAAAQSIQSQIPLRLDVGQIRNPTQLVKPTKLEPCGSGTCLTVQNAAERPLAAVVFTAKNGGYEWLNLLHLTKNPGGIAPGDTYSTQMSTGGSVKSADQVEILAAVLDDGEWQGSPDYARLVLAYWAANVLQGEEASRLLSRLVTGGLSEAAVGSVSSDIRALPEELDDALAISPLAYDDLRLSNVLTGGLQKFAFKAGLSDAKQRALLDLRLIQSSDGHVGEVVASVASGYATRASVERNALRSAIERKAQ